jgi:membrane protein
MVNVLLDASPLILVWVAFTLSFLLIPNTKVKFKYALFSGLICGVAFQIIQLLFVNGQIYVSKYNAIYGSFAFLPLLLIWLQLSWLILLFGALLTYSAQNVFGYNFTDDDKKISDDYFRIFATIVMAIIVKRFDEHKSPLSPREMCKEYDLPVRLLTSVIEKLHDAGLVYFVERDKDSYGIAPAFNTTDYTVGEYWRKLNTLGASGFIPRLNTHFDKIISEISPIISNSYADADNIKLSSLNLPESLPNTTSH